MALFEAFPLIPLEPTGLVWLLAQDGPPPMNPFVSFAPFILIAVMAYFLFIVPQRNKERRFQQMIDGLKQHDRVVTNGGIHGVITAIQRESGEITLRVDEATGAKIQVSMWAIDSVPKKEDDSKAKSSGDKK